MWKTRIPASCAVLIMSISRPACIAAARCSYKRQRKNKDEFSSFWPNLARPMLLHKRASPPRPGAAAPVCARRKIAGSAPAANVRKDGIFCWPHRPGARSLRRRGLQFGKNCVAHLRCRKRLLRPASDICGAHPLGEHGGDGVLNTIGKFAKIERIAQSHAEGANHRDRI